MRGQRVNKDLQERLVRMRAGLNLFAPRHTALAVSRQGSDAEYLGHPQHVDDLTEIQTEEGTFHFMLDYSVNDGGDVIEP